ncbi:hypothetical protein FM038_023180 [Shewanella eurypsychrophilus]|uniref:Uncharacterized protein n=1 Tax=Shewanella eurypsychrophilus TaxID=2593656 RepID=A0ABX6VDG6_9GAMM|nr:MULTISPECIES: hypothetical protein [Shewanella]QFU24746.1 hypothetical protein FS418_24840 [Shewanella sp. YLB-09]QPG59936.1 hypothetical protein FM038_023180 [Shewanella eurypsychrophilus]
MSWVNLLTVLRSPLLAINEVLRSQQRLNQNQQYRDINNEQIRLIKHELDLVSACIVKLKYKMKLIEACITKQESLAINALSLSNDTLAYSIATLIAHKENELSCLCKQLKIMETSQIKLTQGLRSSIKQRQQM